MFQTYFKEFYIKTMSKEKLEFRMYGLVNYQLSGIQKGIQFGHAVVEYGLTIGNTEEYQKWAKEDKTFIILNGGTTNDKPDITTGEYKGTLNQHKEKLKLNRVSIATFKEPDLGDQLTAVVFLVDERVFNKEKYPDFKDYVISKIGTQEHELQKESFLIKTEGKENPTPENIYPNFYKKWVYKIGGEKNVFLRQFLKNFRLA